MRCAPQMIAGKLAEKVACEEIDHVEVVGGYLNVFLAAAGWRAISWRRCSPIRGAGVPARSARGKTLCLDYSSINIAKRFHIGHLSTTMIGNSLKRIYDFNGYNDRGHQPSGRRGHAVRQDDLRQEVGQPRGGRGAACRR